MYHVPYFFLVTEIVASFQQCRPRRLSCRVNRHALKQTALEWWVALGDTADTITVSVAQVLSISAVFPMYFSATPRIEISGSTPDIPLLSCGKVVLTFMCAWHVKLWIYLHFTLYRFSAWSRWVAFFQCVPLTLQMASCSELFFFYPCSKCGPKDAYTIAECHVQIPLDRLLHVKELMYKYSRNPRRRDTDYEDILVNTHGYNYANRLLTVPADALYPGGQLVYQFPHAVVTFRI